MSGKDIFDFYFPLPLIKFYKNSVYNDEPQLFQYSALSKDNVWGGGISFNKKRGQMKAFGESLERYCLEKYNNSQFTFDSANNLKAECLDPASVCSISDKQRKEKNSTILS